MSQATLSMRKIEEILRLKYGAGLTHREIARSCRVSAATVSDYVTRAQAAGLSWPLPAGLTGEELEERLFPASAKQTGSEIVQPDWASVYQELRRAQGGTRRDLEPGVGNVGKINGTSWVCWRLSWKRPSSSCLGGAKSARTDSGGRIPARAKSW